MTVAILPQHDLGRDYLIKDTEIMNTTTTKELHSGHNVISLALLIVNGDRARGALSAMAKDSALAFTENKTAYRPIFKAWYVETSTEYLTLRDAARPAEKVKLKRAMDIMHKEFRKAFRAAGYDLNFKLLRGAVTISNYVPEIKQGKPGSASKKNGKIDPSTGNKAKEKPFIAPSKVLSGNAIQTIPDMESVDILILIANCLDNLDSADIANAISLANHTLAKQIAKENKRSTGNQIATMAGKMVDAALKQKKTDLMNSFAGK